MTTASSAPARFRTLRDRLRPPRPRPPACADRRGARLQPLVRGGDDRAVRGRLGGSGTTRRPSPSRAGRAARWRRCTSPGSRARPCCVRRTRSWRRRSPPSARVRASSSSIATARTCACRSRTSRPRPSGTRPRAAFLVHIGGHIAFEVERIAAYCAEHGIFLIEDCAHAHGASWNGRKAGYLGRCRRLLAVRDKDDLHRRGRRARLPPARGDRARAGVPQLRQAHLRGARAELPDERVHRRARAGADRTAARDRRMEERGRPRRSSIRGIRAGSSCPKGWSPGSTSTSCSTGWSAPPAVSTTSRVTGFLATTSNYPTATGSRETTRAFRCITDLRRLTS